ncbi:flagellar basal body P-ring formation protein FlgA [bacterium]|nr:flagellar basal body P-ring formation protein FlgA [bacterium]
MNMLFSLLMLVSILNAVAIDRTEEIQTAVMDYYKPLLVERVISYEIDIRRCPKVKADGFEITGIRGETGISLPRGNRLCWVDAVTDGRIRALPVTLTVRTRELLPVARCNIPPRTVLNDSLVEWRELSADRLGATRFPSKKQAEGLWTKVRISAGAVLTMARLAPIPAVVVGQRLPIVARKGVVEIVMYGRALKDGFFGEEIRVVNNETGKRYRGILDKNGAVLLE